MNYQEARDLRAKFGFLRILLWGLVALLLVRLFLLQIVSGERYRTVSENNYLRFMVLRSARGILADRAGQTLCRNRVSFSLVLDMTRGGDLDATIESIRRQLGMDITRSQVQAALKRSPIASLAVLARDIPLSWVERVEAHQGELKMLRIEMELRREYPFANRASHAMGYVGLVSPEELREYDIEDADLFQEVGKAGVEKASNAELMGRNGLKCAQVNNLGREVEDPDLRLPGVGVIREPVAGHHVRLNLDMTLQALLEDAFGEETGSALFMDPATGSIQAWVSMPTFDPNLFSGTLTRSEWRALVEDPAHPLINRPVQGAYPAGSTFKPFVALVGLQEGILERDTGFTCNGVMELGNNQFHCWAKGGHGAVDLLTAIQNSCNVFFYRSAERIGINRITRWAKLFGLGEPTGVDLPGERSGTLPSPDWKRGRKLGPWYAGDTLTVAIGQGYLTVTPAQLLSFYGTLATGGVRVRPRVVHAPTEVLSRTTISPDALETVKEGLWRVVNAGGTGGRCRVEGRDVCAKTGTAQVVKASSGKDTYALQKGQRDHAWLAGFAPRDNPKVAFVVMVEHGGHGGDVAARIAKVGLEYILNGRSVGIEAPPPEGSPAPLDEASARFPEEPAP